MANGTLKNVSKGKGQRINSDINSANKRSKIAEEKKTVALRIKSGEYLLVEKDKDSKSISNKNFYTVCDGNENSVNFMKCKKCDALYYVQSGSSTSPLLRHTQSCEAGKASRSSSSAETKSEKVKKTEKVKKSKKEKRKKLVMTPQKKREFRDKVVEMCARDLRPFNIVSGKGFQQLLQECVNIGENYDDVNITAILPHPTTVSRGVAGVADKLRSEFLPKVREAMKQSTCSMDTDLWTDKYTKSHYMTVTSQYITESWELQSAVLLTTEFPAEEAKTGANIKRQLQENLAALDLDLDDVLNNVTFVTDQGSNIKAALSCFKRIPCFAHLLATVLRHLLDENKFLKDCPATLASIKSCRNAVTYLKRSGNSKLLENSVKQMIDCRWHTEFDMLSSVCSSFQDIVKVLISKDEMNRLEDWDAQLMTDLVEFLMPFKEAIVEVQAKKVPTLHLVLVKFHELLDSCDEKPDDSEEMALIKEKAKCLLKEKIELHDVHYVATFLNPSLRLLMGLSDEERKMVHNKVKQMCNQLETGGDETNCKEGGPPPKKSRFSKKWSQTEKDEEITLEDEMKLYISQGKIDSDDPSLILPWWKSKASMFPRLAKLTRRIFAIPATSASSERNFSRAGLTITSLRSSLDSDVVNDLLVIHNFYLNAGDSDCEKLKQILAQNQEMEIEIVEESESDSPIELESETEEK